MDVVDPGLGVAQMGVEPFQRALKGGAQVVLGGRAYDPACFAALPIMQGFDEGLALHCGKILECAAIAATPGIAQHWQDKIVRRAAWLRANPDSAPPPVTTFHVKPDPA